MIIRYLDPEGRVFAVSGLGDRIASGSGRMSGRF